MIKTPFIVITMEIKFKVWNWKSQISNIWTAAEGAFPLTVNTVKEIRGESWLSRVTCNEHNNWIENKGNIPAVFLS